MDKHPKGSPSSISVPALYNMKFGSNSFNAPWTCLKKRPLLLEKHEDRINIFLRRYSIYVNQMKRILKSVYDFVPNTFTLISSSE